MSERNSDTPRTVGSSSTVSEARAIRLGMKLGHAHKIRLAAKARVSLPTVDKALRGEHVRGDAGDRIAEVLRAEGITPEPASGVEQSRHSEDARS